MKLQEAIAQYVWRKRATGMLFAKASSTYEAFSRTVGDLSLNQITIDHVLHFLNACSSAYGFRRKHSLLRHLFEYWVAQGAMVGVPMPPTRPAQASSFFPYIYTRSEIRMLLGLVTSCQTSNDKIHPKTLSAAFLMLYATGATVGEVTRLVNCDVDLEKGWVKVDRTTLRPARCIPIGRDLVRVEKRFVQWRISVGIQSEYFFCRMDGSGVTPRALRAYFERLRRLAGMAGYYQSSQRPCLRDLRATFAVHQITSWIKKRKNLDVMLPALGAYMGNTVLESTERYLQLTPERFQNSLNKLSPQRPNAPWREDPNLLAFLSNL